MLKREKTKLMYFVVYKTINVLSVLYVTISIKKTIRGSIILTSMMDCGKVVRNFISKKFCCSSQWNIRKSSEDLISIYLKYCIK